jgi:basic membrane lipoprotein Med (substrate-binding protein (PBP1-ABC) superfamily)
MGIYAARGYYQDALKQGQKEYKQAIHRGQYPYIQALSQVEANSGTLARVGLGRMEIPIYLIAGSTEQQRCSSFSPSFYPLLDVDTEFADKWLQLCTAQLEEGIRDPIKCFEYLGHFYVTEGNKRVSVLRSLGALEITAEVTRLLPAQEDNLTVQLYQEFLDFYQYSHFYGLHFSDTGGYRRIQADLGLGAEETWSVDFRRRFQYCYMRFRDCFYGMGGEHLDMTTGDVLLHWFRFYAAADFLDMTDGEYRQSLENIWGELYQDDGPVAVSPEPTGEEKTGGWRSLRRPKPLHVAFLFQESPETSPWAAAHDLGRAYLEKTLGDQVVVARYCGVTDDNAETVIQQAVEDGAELIFSTTVGLLDAALRAAVRYPKVQIMNCSIDQPYTKVRTYYSRVYEGKFITGAIAGALCKQGDIGYVGSYPILGVPASINAFALGVSLTNPEAKIQLQWNCLPGDPLAYFRERGITLISDRDNNGLTNFRGAMGLFRYGPDGTPQRLASPRWDWGVFYVRMVQEFLWNRRKTAQEDMEARAVNYWWGMSSGVVDLTLAPELPEGVQALARALRAGIENGTLQPFHRVIRTQDGTLVNDGTRDLTMDEILNIDWLSDQVEGCMPQYEDLLPFARETVRRLGVDRQLRTTP